ncbi:MAG: hypothetical protein P1U87_21025 [Verrucomicrobiales bacterium]|nr:hypothetical protein [Verrucomicrobiales bacterium]
MRIFLPALVLLLLFPRTENALVAQEKTQEEAAHTTEIQQTAAIGIPVKLDISRRFLKNFLTDEDASIPYETPEGEPRDLSGAFMIGSPNAQYVAIWDPDSARLLGVLDLKAPQPKAAEKAESEDEGKEEKKAESEEPSPYVLLAAGNYPLQASSGAFGTPSYFGFRVVAGRPCFLYTHGSLIVEETIWLEDDGNVLKQQFSIREPEGTIALRLPASWKERASTEVGEWDGNTLKIPAESEGKFTIAFRLDTPEDGKENE